MMWPLETLQSPAWRPLTWTLLHFLWQGAAVAGLWIVLFHLFRGSRTQFRYLLGLAGMFLMAACPVATFVFLESAAIHAEALRKQAEMVTSTAYDKLARDVPQAGGSMTPEFAHSRDAFPAASVTTLWRVDLAERIGDAQPFLLCGWILGLAFLSGRLLLGVVGIRRLGRGRLAVSGEIADRAADLAVRLGFRGMPGIFSSAVAREAIVTGLLRPMVLLPAAWLVEMPPEVLEAVIAHELAHIRRFDLWFNLFQRFVETLLFYHPAVWWLSRRVRLAREMCCDELAAKATGERVVYATALELAARKRLEPPKSLLEVALGVTKMTLLDRVRNVLGLAVRHEQARWWPAAVLSLLMLPAVWLATMTGCSSSERDSKGTATAFLRILMQEPQLLGGPTIASNETDRFEIYKNTQCAILTGNFVLRAALQNPKIAKLPSIQAAQASGDPVKWLADRLEVQFPGKAEIMKVSFHGKDRKEAALVLNAVVDAYMTEVVTVETDKKSQRLDELEKICAAKDQDLRQKREQSKRMALDSGASESGELGMREKLFLEQLAVSRQDQAKVREELRHYQAELAVQKAFLEDAKSDDRVPILKEIKRLEIRITIAADQDAVMEAKLEKMNEEARRFGIESVGMRMLREDIKHLDAASAQLAAEIEKLKVEIKAPPRICVVSRAE
jgi:beta-lactamase regulating signal transducer with metallopeptidase domain